MRQRVRLRHASAPGVLGAVIRQVSAQGFASVPRTVRTGAGWHFASCLTILVLQIEPPYPRSRSQSLDALEGPCLRGPASTSLTVALLLKELISRRLARNRWDEEA